MPHSPSQYPPLLASCPDFLCRLSFPCSPSLFCSHLGLALCLCLQLIYLAHHLSNYILLLLPLSFITIIRPTRSSGMLFMFCSGKIFEQISKIAYTFFKITII